MDVSTMWTAARGVAVSAALLVHGTPQTPVLVAATPAHAHTGVPAELLHHVPLPISIDQALAAMHR
ncbi:MAG: hypothetical protein Q8K45_06770 [Rubrivivax sp.]|nr:hypothetical protein [Rubrivivax sp.]